MLVRFTNTLLLVLVIALAVTGLYGLVWPLQGWSFELHRLCGWAFIALIPWKGLISFRSVRRGLRWTFDRGVVIVLSLAVAAWTVIVLALGLSWAWRLTSDVLWPGYSPITLHWVLGLALVPPLAIHIWRRWPRPKREEFFSRRGLLRLFGLSLAGAAGWQVSRVIARGRQDPDHVRRLTGSREHNSFEGNRFPVTTNPGHAQAPVDARDWKLAISGLVARPFELSYDELLGLPASEITATLDCTVGWYSTQVWRGVPLPDLLRFAAPAPEARWVQLRALSGYAHTFTLVDTSEMLLATHVSGEVLGDRHGFPLRAVIPSRRGWFWVKWLTAVEVLERRPA